VKNAVPGDQLFCEHVFAEPRGSAVEFMVGVVVFAVATESAAEGDVVWRGEGEGEDGDISAAKTPKQEEANKTISNCRSFIVSRAGIRLPSLVGVILRCDQEQSRPNSCTVVQNYLKSAEVGTQGYIDVIRGVSQSG
jgi:hypothetical protein